MTKLEQAARQALDALEDISNHTPIGSGVAHKAITALREALAEPKKPEECANGCPPLQVCDYCQTAEQAEQKPVAWRDDFERCRVQHVESFCHSHKVFQMMQKYAAPVRTKDLTDDEVASIGSELAAKNCVSDIAFARAVIAADREKNHGS